jgi:nucleotide-binding universal stress UspA family protein
MPASAMPVTRTEDGRQDPAVRVIVGVDDSPAGLAALRWAVGYARLKSAPLVAVRVWELGLPRHGGLRHHAGRGLVVLSFHGTGARDAAAKLTERAFGASVGGIPCDLDVAIETPEGNPGPVLTQIASRSGDVLVVGTSPGPSVKRAMHGSVTAYCTAHSRCPVTVVKPGRMRRAAAPSGDPAPASAQAPRFQRRDLPVVR